MDLQKQHLIAAFLSMEPTDWLLSLARKCGSGSITEDVQSFVWEHCVDRDNKCHTPYLKLFLKKLIKEVESTGGCVLDEFYECYASYMASPKEDAQGNTTSWVMKRISFLFHDVPGFSDQMQLVVPLQCSLNMLEGDTGCALWPSSLFLSEFVLSFPEIFTRKTCFEVGSGVGLLGICLHHVKASKVVLSDGDASTLANLKLNLETNKISTTDAVQCIHLPWESAQESELKPLNPDIVVGADVIYDPSCLPDLIRVISILLNGRNPVPKSPNEKTQRPRIQCYDNAIESYAQLELETATMESVFQELESRPIALIASVIRNIDTFRCFMKMAQEANIRVRDLSKNVRPFKLLPYMDSYKRADVHLFLLSHS